MTDLPGHVDDDVLVRYLRGRGADELPHGGGRTLLDHLIGTRRIVRAWRQPRTIVDAALFHSVYGTDVYPLCTVGEADRDEVRALIGTRAESLAALFATIDRSAFRKRLQAFGSTRPLDVPSRNDERNVVTVAPAEIFALLVLYMANELEQARDVAEDRARVWTTLVAMSRYLDPAYGTIPDVFKGPSLA